MPKVRSARKIPVHVWIPPIYSASYKVTVERENGTIDDITNRIVKLRITDGVTESIGSFEVELLNGDEKYNGAWTGMEIFRYYSDYEASATTLRFRGRIEKPSYKETNIIITGRSEALFVQGQDVNKEYTEQDAGLIIKDLFDTYGQSRFDTSGINIATGNTLTMSFVDSPFWDAVEAVCSAVSYDCYVDSDLVIQFFEAGTKLNLNEGIVHTYNLVEVGDFANDKQFVKNQIRVIGGKIDGVSVRYTAGDTTSQTADGIRREVINDDGITTLVAAKELAEVILADRKDTPVVGEVKGLLLATIQPGDSIRLSSPLSNLPPAEYRIISHEHKISQEGLYTSVQINKELRKISHVMKDRIQRENKKTDSSSNLDDLDFSDIELFNSNVGVHSNTQILGGILGLSAGKTSGSWVSPLYSPGTGNNINKVKVDIVGDNIQGATIEVSLDGGSSYATVSRNELLTSGLGANIKIRLTLTTNTQIDSLNIQYSTV